MLNKETHTLRIQNINLLIKLRRRHSDHFQSNIQFLYIFFLWKDKAIRVKVLSLVQQSQEGSVSTLDRRSFPNIGDNMVLQSFDLNGSCGGIDHLPPYIGDYAPSTAAFYTDLDSTPYSQGKFPKFHLSIHQILVWSYYYWQNDECNDQKHRPTHHSVDWVIVHFCFSVLFICWSKFVQNRRNRVQMKKSHLFFPINSVVLSHIRKRYPWYMYYLKDIW